MKLLTRYAFCQLLAVFVLLAGCGEVRQPVKIGCKDFTEQKLLAEMMALLAEQQGVRVRRAIPYGGNRKILNGIEQSMIDAYPEYDGTLFTLSGSPVPVDPDQTIKKARELVKPLGLSLLEPFGLVNNYVLAIRRDLAIRRGITSISDLDTLEHSLRFAVDKDYLVRPVEGLDALTNRYGLRVSKPLVFPVGERQKIFDALADRLVDAAVVYSTDSRLHDYGMVVLEDDLGFYPTYRPAPLARSAVLSAFPKLAVSWGKLAGRIDAATMRDLIGKVERSGEDYRDVARSYLEDLDLMEKQPAKELLGAVTLAVDPVSDQGYLPIHAAEAIREVMVNRRLRVITVQQPARAVRTGKARFALIGAEEFYELTVANGHQKLKEARDIEAVGVVGTRFVHIVTRPDTASPRQWKKIGVCPEGGSSWKTARLVLNALQLEKQVQLVSGDTPTTLLQMLDEEGVDAMLVMAKLNHAGLVKMLQTSKYQLAQLEAFRGRSPALRYPFLRPARIPANTYPGQAEAIDTVASQVVLATRVPVDSDIIGESGPGFVPGVFTRLPQRLPYQTARRLATALETNEAVDLVLPASPGLQPEAPPVQRRIEGQPAATLLNFLVICFLAGMLLLLFRDLPSAPALKPGSEEHEPS